MKNVTSIAKDAIINFEETIDDLSRHYRERFGYGDSIRVVPYTSYGVSGSVRVCGRVLADQKVESDKDDHVARNLFNMLRRYKTEDVAGARLKLTIGETVVELTCDDEGYYDEMIDLDTPLPADSLFATYTIELLEPHSRNEQYETTFEGRIEVPQLARFGVISDIDDTVVYTGAHDFLKHARTVVLNNAHTRLPFAGVAPFYRALSKEQGERTNPLFYVSSSPTNLYELFVDFMESTGIPAGPIMLKDFGFEEGKFFKSAHEGYKRERIEEILELYPQLSFILVGDSGQKDAEIYREIVKEHSDRILAVYIRDVSEGDRDAEIDAITEELERVGVPMFRMEDTLMAAQHAAEKNWITPGDLEEVRRHVEDPDIDSRDGGMVGGHVVN